MSDGTSTTKPNQDDAPLWGVTGIAREIRRGRGATRDLLEHGDLPGKKVGDRWVTTRNRLRRALGVAETRGAAMQAHHTHHLPPRTPHRPSGWARGTKGVMQVGVRVRARAEARRVFMCSFNGTSQPHLHQNYAKQRAKNA